MSNQSRKTSTPDADSGTKRRWLNIGPGIILALAVSVLVGARYVSNQGATQRQRSGPPIVERQVISSSRAETSGPTPEVSFIVERAARLHLTPDQTARLRTLQDRWQAFVSPKMHAANQAASKTNDYLANAKGNRRTPVVQIESAAGPLIALSGEISSARRAYWDQAMRILDPHQRKALQAEREADWAARMKRLSTNTRARE